MAREPICENPRDVAAYMAGVMQHLKNKGGVPDRTVERLNQELEASGMHARIEADEGE